MSRHRMVRNLTEDDYYDDYDDDYYEDEDYYEDDHAYAPPSKQTTTKNTTMKTSSLGTNNTLTAKIAVSGKAATTASVGVTKPPPGWGKPTPPATSTPGISKPPTGWGKPTSTPAVSISDGGVTKPPPGWGKPQPATISASTPPSGGIKEPPPGWGKPTASSSPTKKTASNSATTTKTKNASGVSNTSPPFKPKPIPAFLQPPKNPKKTKTTPAVEEEGTKSQLSMVVLGHVDAGKSTLMGQLLIQTGKIAKREAQKLSGTGAGPANLSWLLDENESERAHGVTMEIGTKGITTDQHDIVLLDAPGHADFIPIMITGAANADTAILVVAAVKGEFEAGFTGGGQTKEHILLAKGLGVSQVIVAVNKLDVEGWDATRYQMIQSQIQDYLLQQQFKAPRIQFVPLSGLTGENVKKRTDPKLEAWYSGPTLLEAMNNFKPANRQLDRPFRFIVTDMYAEGKGVVARGRVVQGFLNAGEKVVVLPIGDPATVSKIEHVQPPASNHPQRLSYAVAGDTVELVLSGIDPMRISVGNIVVEPTGRPPILKKAKARLLVMDNLKVPIIRGAQALFHMHSLDVPAVLTKLVALTKKDGTIHKERPRALTSGASAIVELTLSDKIVMERFQDCRALGRFVLRRGGDTIAVGIIDELVQ